MRGQFFVIAFVAFSVNVCPADAAVFLVDLIDNDGPHISGQVDTSLDILTVTSWTENAGGTAFWTPSTLSRTYSAIDFFMSPFDVPDNWNGTIGTNWGFLNNNDLNATGWNEGTFMSPGIVIFDGWGASQLQGSLSTFQTEMRWDLIPTGNSSFANAQFDTVSVSLIPEPGSLSMFALSGFAGLALLRRKRVG